ncbi:MAG: GNAT family N-acetyltransferase [Chloroherpetonaceae bacterium]|nr:GNAT family N-acetyltransferase [Chthonomonadaceae bacterium]MDW8206364.1 GNAT family N-acetyltransferase [Chloroherpetonaceae bacterium]
MSVLEIDIARTAQEREALFALRMQVFVQEQHVPEEEEIDACDQTATHFVIRCSPPPPDYPAGVIGTARLINKGENTGKIGRVAVAAAFRRMGAGTRLMQFIEAYAREQGLCRLVLDAQCAVIPFYERLGYTAEGDVFIDAGIEHRFMYKDLTTSREVS